METQAQELMECSSGQAKYEHQHKAIVWRVPRLPKLGQGIIIFFSFHSAIKGARTSDLLLSHRTMIVRKYEENSNLLLFFQPSTEVWNVNYD